MIKRLIRLYLMAHAPAEPQLWFKPAMPPCPELPKFTEITDPAVRTDVITADHGDTDPETAEGEAFMTRRREAATAIRQWQRENERQRLIQWPRGWADAVMGASK